MGARSHSRRRRGATPGPEGARPISALAWNVNGIHVHSRKGIGDTSDEGLGDGSDLLAEPQARMRTVVDLIVQEKTRIAVLTETHMRAAELTAAVGYLPRVHGLEAFGTAGGYSGRKGARASGGVLVVWDPSVLISEGTEVVKAHRIVRVSLRVKADGASLHLVGAYMPVRRQTNCDEVDEAWGYLDVEAMRPDFMCGGDLNAEMGADGTDSDRLLNEMCTQRTLTSYQPQGPTYESGGVKTKIDH
jgi:hypothetical protein